MTRVHNRPVKIIVIEDDPDFLNALNIMLGAAGFDVDVLLNGRSIIQNQFIAPDLFIIDTGLTDIDGLDICLYLKSKPNYKDIPVILMSSSQSMKDRTLEAGACHFIEKPFELNILIEAINHALEEKGMYH